MLRAFEDWNVFVPTRADSEWIEPAGVGLIAEDVALTSADGTRLHGWWCPGNDSLNGAPGAVLFMHGNAGNLSHRARSILEWQYALRMPAFIIDYPGYGRSLGRPSEPSCYAAAYAAYDWLTRNRNIPPEQILLYGDSLGGGVAIELALHRPHHILILARSFTSIPDMAKRLFPFLPASWLRRLVHNRFDNAGKIGNCPRPIFIAHGDCDRIIPYEHGQKLFALAPEPKRFHCLAGCDHNDPLGPDFHAALRDFLREVRSLPLTARAGAAS